MGWTDGPGCVCVGTYDASCAMIGCPAGGLVCAAYRHPRSNSRPPELRGEYDDQRWSVLTPLARSGVPHQRQSSALASGLFGQGLHACPEPPQRWNYWIHNRQCRGLFEARCCPGCLIGRRS
jgi:hypothetical protein